MSRRPASSSKPLKTPPAERKSLISPRRRVSQTVQKNNTRSWKSKHSKRNHIIVLDIDQTLVDSEGFKTSSPDRRYVLEVDDIRVSGSTRPNLSKFLSYVFDAFDKVVLWTAGTDSYAESIKSLLEEEGVKFDLVWSRNHCLYDEPEGFYHKPIDFLAVKMDCDPDSIVVVDDKHYTFTNNPNHGILIPPYNGQNEDDALGRLVDWFEKPAVKHSWSVASLNKDEIFTQRATC